MEDEKVEGVDVETIARIPKSDVNYKRFAKDQKPKSIKYQNYSKEVVEWLFLHSGCVCP